jgi:type I restriction enzyme M protein
MLRGELQKDIDNKWDACWPMNSLRPLAILDLISYLFFLKKLEEEGLINETRFKSRDDNFIGLNEVDDIRWSKFKNMNAQDAHELFIKQNGILDLIKKYGETNFPYSIFLKGALLLNPTVTLLIVCIDILKIIDTEDDVTKANIFEYLLNKAEVTGQNGQIFLPGNIINLLVSLLQPGASDIIWDPSAGNGSLLVKSADYITNKKFIPAQNFKDVLDSYRYTGIESDLINLRIGAMNMILHGIHEPKLEATDVSDAIHNNQPAQPALILSNLFFAAVEDKMTVEENTLKAVSTRKEITFLNHIIKNLKPGRRAVVVIPEVILYSNRIEIKSLRQQLIDNCKLEAVISIPCKNDSIFSGATILIFSESIHGKTEKVWFYKKKTGKEDIKNSHDENIFKSAAQNFSEHNGYLEILNQWKNREKETEKNKTDEIFYVTATVIKNNNYNLVFNEYKMLFKTQELFGKTEGASANKKNTITNARRQPLFPDAQKKPASKKRPFKRAVLIIVASIVVISLAYLAFYFQEPNDEASVQKKSDNISGTIKDSVKIPIDNNSATLPDTANITNKKYAVISRAYFYSSPVENTKRSIYINNTSHITLNPTNEKNGFIYVIYINKNGQTTKGWLNKKDLNPLP